MIAVQLGERLLQVEGKRVEISNVLTALNGKVHHVHGLVTDLPQELQLKLPAYPSPNEVDRQQALVDDWLVRSGFGPTYHFRENPYGYFSFVRGDLDFYPGGLLRFKMLDFRFQNHSFEDLNCTRVLGTMYELHTPPVYGMSLAQIVFNLKNSKSSDEITGQDKLLIESIAASII